jgi:hypothetical protein
MRLKGGGADAMMFMAAGPNLKTVDDASESAMADNADSSAVEKVRKFFPESWLFSSVFIG